ncbi:dihydrolipoyl dehydrogenase [Leptospira levettii]|uniref:Dihydrolipoyl dehydrogenase n=1 Tax=Leptospira levettii TaxID=2023178 RepID=A0ABY2MNE3_9LEPT|nr:dihydrolipoyl dehydrogenase [Leptospira levettii]TGL70810.1 dihydrolipoyl dehydrogenase [Leptospira levettii]TGM28037.1 dihydrolipoyl dehydrogenase [Leptospira levettii]TGM33297.1 dihydrolipoyl dehydrogenase [Leptospira levettii]TGM65488.1 dihydrolipoyl dehydrogenase [Leptospira levettii]TGM82795.1 dihydrolipoyl dehydrogenase [Leptospira levettii]
MKEYDILVVGAGAGTKLVTPPSLIGKRVVVFEKETPGGTCLNRGCIPSKMIIYPSELVRLREEGERFGINFPKPTKVPVESIFQRVNQTVKADSDSIPIAYEKNPNIDYIPKKVWFKASKVLTDGENDYTAKHIFIVTGTSPKIPNIQGLENTPYWTSREALSPTKFPKSLLIIGAGFISLELGAAYQAYGCQVTGITRGEILRHLDGDIKTELGKHLPFPIHTHFQFESVSYQNNKFIVSGKTNDGKFAQFESDELLVATGIKPNTDELHLENTNIKVNEEGFIQVDDNLQTEEPGVYAFGDVIGRYFFRHSANFEGEYLFDHLFGNKKGKPIVYPPIPEAIFTNPQIASVGKTEETLIKEGISYYKGINPYSSSATGMARLSHLGFVKVLVSKETEQVLGAHIIGEEASNLIHQILMGMYLNAKLDDYLGMVYIHPAISEITRNAFRKVRDQKLKEGKS